MNINGIATRTICPASGERAVDILDQTALPHVHRTVRLRTLEDATLAISDMRVRGAPLIGVTAAYGVALALANKADDAAINRAVGTLAETRPTAINLRWALNRMQSVLMPLPVDQRAEAAWREAGAIAEEDVAQNRRIGEHGLKLLRPLAHARGRLDIMTHCNAGWLATVDYGTALAPIYTAVEAGLEVHVWVSETRPRNQGLLTAWELRERGVPYTAIVDNAAGLLLSQRKVDAVIVGADRIAGNGDVANKVGTFLKALAARHAEIPFFVAAPGSTIDFSCLSGAAIPIEERDGDEIRLLSGTSCTGEPNLTRLLPPDAHVFNAGFDVTPAELVTSIITERGTCAASNEGLRCLYPKDGCG